MARDRDATPSSMDPASILEHFALLPDPRREHGQIHRLDEVVFMAICGVLCGADSWQAIADYSESKLDWLSTFLVAVHRSGQGKRRGSGMSDSRKTDILLLSLIANPLVFKGSRV